MDPQAAAKPYVKRFGAYGRISHFFLMTSFLGLAGTGLPLLYSHARWAWWLSRMWGGFETARVLHRFCASILIAVFVYHLCWVIYRVIFKRELGLLWGPGSMVPQPRDFREIWAHMKWFVGKGPRPVFDRFTYWEKFDYLAVFWGVFIIGGSGLLLWFPAFMSRFMPGWMFNIAETIHGEEALLAIGFIFTIHFFNGHLRPGKFPIDTVIFTGRMPRHELDEDRTHERDRLAAAGRLESVEVDAPSGELVLIAKVIGFAAVGFGVVLVVLIIYSSLR